MVSVLMVIAAVQRGQAIRANPLKPYKTPILRMEGLTLPRSSKAMTFSIRRLLDRPADCGQTSRRKRQGGFTLLEIMVAIMVLGFLLAGLAQATQFGLRAWSMQARMIDRRANLDAVDRTLRGLDPGYRVDPPNIVGTAHGFAFTASPPEGAALAAGVTERRMDVLLEVDGCNRLVLRWTPALHARRLATPPPHETVLLEGVAQLDLAYWHDEDGGGWADSWDGRAPPALVRIGLVFVPGGPQGNAA